MKIYNGVTKLIGHTPMVRLKKIEEKYGLKAALYAKLEGFNPGGSIKDRVALAIILDAEKKGLLKEGSTIIEPTSGNTGIGLSMLAKTRGYQAVIVMPDSMSKERIDLMTSYGAKVILTPAKEGMQGSINKTLELEKEIPNSFIAGQFTNPVNPLAHYQTTGPEIWEDLDGKVDIFVAGIGTGGTISGTGKYLKEQKNLKVVGVEPASSPLLTKGFAGGHKIQGIGANFIPENLNRAILDEVYDCSDLDAYQMTKEVALTEGILVGISSGAALKGAIEEAKKPNNSGKNIVCIFPDGGSKYLSTGVFQS